MPLRKTQQAVVDYDSGKMGIAAVPGSGKTFTLSHLAAKLVESLVEQGIAEEREVLIVTLTNSAVNSFRASIAKLLKQERGLLPYVGYRVRTLHSLAHDIVRERPGLVGLSENFEIVDERVTTFIIRELAEGWIRSSGHDLLPYISLGVEVASDEQLSWVIRKNAPELVESLAREVITLAKDNMWSTDQLQEAMLNSPISMPLAEIAIELYEGYERALRYRGAVDFDDLVRLAMRLLRENTDYLERLHGRFPYILEDEAQDSSKLQNNMLRLLSGDQNWVRVGDPNQSIYTTFTTADSNLLRAFLDERDVAPRPLNESGRSSQDIMRLANYLLEWSASGEAVPEELRRTFFQQQITPTPTDDPQINPDNGDIYIDWEPGKNITPEEEIRRVVASIQRWLPDNKDKTVAVLVPENSRGFKVVEAFKEAEIPYEELLRSSTATREAASQLQLVIDFAADPTHNRALARLYSDVWWPQQHPDIPEENAESELRLLNQAYDELKRLTNSEDFLVPGPEGDWLDVVEPAIGELAAEDLRRFREQARLWMQASTLPVDQLILTVAQDLFKHAADLALAHKLAVVMRSIAESNTDYRLPQLASELRMIAENQRRFLGFDDAGSGFEPAYGVVTVSTMHAAKGLEWDRVYLLAVNNYSFPMAVAGDSYIAEKWYVRDELNLQAETRRQVELLMEDRTQDYEEGEASKQARFDYAAERLRLLYVGITRAKQDLAIFWNMGRFWEKEHLRNGPSAALIALKDYWEKNLK